MSINNKNLLPPPEVKLNKGSAYFDNSQKVLTTAALELLRQAQEANTQINVAENQVSFNYPAAYGEEVRVKIEISDPSYTGSTALDSLVDITKGVTVKPDFFSKISISDINEGRTTSPIFTYQRERSGEKLTYRHKFKPETNIDLNKTESTNSDGHKEMEYNQLLRGFLVRNLGFQDSP